MWIRRGVGVEVGEELVKRYRSTVTHKTVQVFGSFEINGL